MGTIAYSGQPAATDAALISAGADMIIPHVIGSNVSGTDRTLTLSVHRVNGQVETIAAALPIPTGTAQEVIWPTGFANGGLVLRSGDSLHGSASAATAVTVLAFQ